MAINKRKLKKDFKRVTGWVKEKYAQIQEYNKPENEMKRLKAQLAAQKQRNKINRLKAQLNPQSRQPSTMDMFGGFGGSPKPAKRPKNSALNDWGL